MYMLHTEREMVCVHVTQRERDGEREMVCVHVTEREREMVCVHARWARARAKG